MIFKQFIRLTICLLSLQCFAYSQDDHNIIVGHSDSLMTTKEAINIICFGFEANHPNNQCKSTFVDSEIMWDELMNNNIQIALMPEEVIIANQRKRPQPLIIMPLYQQYLILIGSQDLSMDNLQSFRDRTIGVTDWATKEYRGKPVGLALGLKEQDVYFPISNTYDQLSNLFCSFAIDGVMIMSDPSSALARELTTSCNGQIMSFTDQQIQKTLKSSLGLYEGTIPKGMYWRVNEDIKTLRSRIFLVINPTRKIAKSVLDSLDHIQDEINLVTLRTDITAQSIIDTYDIKPPQLHAKGQKLIDDLRSKINDSLLQSADELSHENQEPLH